MQSMEEMQALFDTAPSARYEGENTGVLSVGSSKCNKNSVSLSKLSLLHVPNHAPVILLSHKITTKKPLTQQAVRPRHRTQPPQIYPMLLQSCDRLLPDDRAAEMALP